MYGDDPRDLAKAPNAVDEPREARAKHDEEEVTDTNRPRTTLQNEGLNGE
jgi:hypothetical protein